MSLFHNITRLYIHVYILFLVLTTFGAYIITSNLDIIPKIFITCIIVGLESYVLCWENSNIERRNEQVMSFFDDQEEWECALVF